MLAHYKNESRIQCRFIDTSDDGLKILFSMNLPLEQVKWLFGGGVKLVLIIRFKTFSVSHSILSYLPLSTHEVKIIERK